MLPMYLGFAHFISPPPPPRAENPRGWEVKCILTKHECVCAYKGLKNHQISNRKHIFAMLFNAA